MDGDQALAAVFDWFRGIGGSVGDSSNVPVEVSLSNGLFYVGVLDPEELEIEVSALLYLGAESTGDEELRIGDIAEEISSYAPDDITVETIISDGTDIWAAIVLVEEDLAPDILSLRLRSFVDYSLRTMDEVQRQLHPLDLIQPTQESDALTTLKDLVGIDELVTKAEELLSLAKVATLRRSEGLKASAISPHLVFTGNPGTGKTTVARLMGAIYKEIGLLPSGHLIEARRSDLIGQYIGSTTPKTEKVIKSAIGGVLFIDEAYSLLEGYNNGRSYGEECITTLLLAMENFKGQFALIVAGYPEEMIQFINSNPGLRSRFDQVWHFRDYTNEELVTIVERYVAKNDYVLASGCADKLVTVFAGTNRDKYFGNARFAREVFHYMKRLHAVRVLRQKLTSREDLMRILPEDIHTISKTRPKPPFGFTRTDK